jgi:signal transduction histidine kinase
MPLGELRRGVEIIGKGNLDYRVNVRRGDEIGQFASQLNLMAAALQERDRRLILTERLAAIGKMASHIAHEVKNPLSSIGLNTELVSEEAREIGDEKRRGEILALTTSISREVDRMTSLVNHYLQFGRPPKPRKADTDLGALVAEVRDFMAPEMKSAGVRIDVCAPGEAVVAGVDRDQIKQVMINLLKNAMEAMDDSAARSVRLELEKSADHAILTVSDTGRGMTGEERDKIFEPFYSSKKGGSGLGLPLTRQIVLDHGGSIEVASEKGVGTTFEIALPLS